MDKQELKYQYYCTSNSGFEMTERRKPQSSKSTIVTKGELRMHQKYYVAKSKLLSNDTSALAEMWEHAFIDTLEILISTGTVK